MVTQFLDDNVEIDESDYPSESPYRISSSDAYGSHNMIRGKIIDYGNLKVQDRKTGYYVDPCDVPETLKNEWQK